ncbi:MAG: hypothetical protein P1P76_12570, partial [Anaerolineales bacterium]|nr:hypothetical protein [Anaerolineales bacterium]
ESHEVFEPLQGNDASWILLLLDFESDSRIRAEGRQIAHWLQSPRLITELDARKLQIFAEEQPRI